MLWSEDYMPDNKELPLSLSHSHCDSTSEVPSNFYFFRLKAQIPDLERSVDMIKMLKKKKDSTEDFQTNFLLSEQVYMKASISPTDKVCLWLGVSYRQGKVLPLSVC